MIISKATYNEMLDLINEQRHQIEKLTRENNRLKNDKRLLLNVLMGDPFDIDFPNTHAKGGNVVNTHVDCRDYTSNYPLPRHNGNISY